MQKTPAAGRADRAIPGRIARRQLLRMTLAHELGRAAEALAASYLERRGWTILERNWRAGHKEIDLIAVRAGVLAFVEVKARRRRTFGHPLDAIGRVKRRELALAARAWLARAGPAQCADCRFDAIWVIGDPDGAHELEHVAGAWRL
ncbi:MAG: YraN family protein [Gemmatimonadetes bacterium]|nr:YraN family protein [Gemmatimonadota bacterium]